MDEEFDFKLGCASRVDVRWYRGSDDRTCREACAPNPDKRLDRHLTGAEVDVSHPDPAEPPTSGGLVVTITKKADPEDIEPEPCFVELRLSIDDARRLGGLLVSAVTALDLAFDRHLNEAWQAEHALAEHKRIMGELWAGCKAEKF
jgi:hypothetical protein